MCLSTVPQWAYWHSSVHSDRDYVKFRVTFALIHADKALILSRTDVTTQRHEGNKDYRGEITYLGTRFSMDKTVQFTEQFLNTPT